MAVFAGRVARHLGRRSAGVLGSVPRVATFSSTPAAPKNINNLFEEHVQEFPFMEALRVPRQKIRSSYKELKVAVAALATGLRELGFVPGSRLLVWVDDPAVHSILQLAAARAAVVLCYIPRESSQEVVENCINTVKPYGVLFCLQDENEFPPPTRIDKLGEIMPTLKDQGGHAHWARAFNTFKFPSIQRLLHTDPIKRLHGIHRLRDCMVYDTSNLCKYSKPVQVDGNHPFLIQTSADGLKAWEFTQDQVASNALALGERLALQPANRLLINPADGTVSRPAEFLTSFLASLFRTAVTIHGGADLVHATVMDSPTHIVAPSATLKEFSADAKEYKEQFDATTWISTDGWAAGGGPTLVAFHRGQSGSDAGEALPGVQAKVVDGSGKEVAAGTVGKLMTKGPHVSASVEGDGWVETHPSASLTSGRCKVSA